MRSHVALSHPRPPRRSLALLLISALVGTLLAVLAAPARPADAQSSSSAGEYVPLSPARVYDSRQGAGGIAPYSSRDIQVTGLGGVPATDVVAVVIDVTAVPTGEGWGLVWPAGTPRPSPASSLNYVPGRPVTNVVTTKVASTGRASYYSYQAWTDVIFDVVGYYRASPGGAGYNPLTQTRVLDSRTTAKLAPGQTLDLRLRGAAGVPDSASVSAVALNLSAFDQDGPGFLANWPRGQAAAETSALNFDAYRMQTALVVATVSADGWISIYNHVTAATQVLVDVVGYYTAGSGNRFIPLAPKRVVDTRYGTPGYGVGPLTAPLAPNTTTAVQLTGVGGVPATGVSTVAVNATVDRPSAAGFLSAWASGDPPPGTISLTYYAGETTANLILAKVGPDGKANLTNYYATTPLVLDVVGYYTTQPGPSPPANVIAAPGDGAATVAWAAPAGDGGAPVDGYLLRTFKTGSPRTALGETTTCGTCTSATLAGLTDGQGYQFDVFARNRGGYGTPASSNIVTPGSAPDLLAPTAVVATRGDRQAQLTWVAPITHILTPVSYSITVHKADGTQVGSPTSVAATPAATVAATATGLTNGVSVYFRITATSLIFVTSPPAQSNTVTPAGPPLKPTGVSAGPGDGQATVSWLPVDDNGDAITGYTITTFNADNSVAQTLPTASEPVKAFETTFHADLMSASGLGSLIHATVGSFGGDGGRCRNRAGLTA